MITLQHEYSFLSIINNKISRVMIGQELSSCCLSILYNKVYKMRMHLKFKVRFFISITVNCT